MLLLVELSPRVTHLGREIEQRRHHRDRPADFPHRPMASQFMTRPLADRAQTMATQREAA